MRNWVNRATCSLAPVPAGGVISGEGCGVNAAFGIAATDARRGRKVKLTVEGCSACRKAASEMPFGGAVYWDRALGCVHDGVEAIR